MRTATEVLLDEISTIRIFHMERAVGVGGSEVKFEPKSPFKISNKGVGRVVGVLLSLVAPSPSQSLSH